MVDVCILYRGVWFGCYLLESVCLCACQSPVVSFGVRSVMMRNMLTDVHIGI